jgi:hypothetical protein
MAAINKEGKCRFSIADFVTSPIYLIALIKINQSAIGRPTRYREVVLTPLRKDHRKRDLIRAS